MVLWLNYPIIQLNLQPFTKNDCLVLPTDAKMFSAPKNAVNMLNCFLQSESSHFVFSNLCFSYWIQFKNLDILKKTLLGTETWIFLVLGARAHDLCIIGQEGASHTFGTIDDFHSWNALLSAIMTTCALLGIFVQLCEVVHRWLSVGSLKFWALTSATQTSPLGRLLCALHMHKPWPLHTSQYPYENWNPLSFWKFCTQSGLTQFRQTFCCFA